MSSKLSIAYDSIRSRDKAIEDLEGQIGALESDKYEALYFYEKAMKGREEWQGKAFAAEAEVAALRAQVAELEAALNHQNTLRESLSDMIGIQSQDGNWNYNDYMRGLANGLLLAHATMTEGAYKPFSPPAQWIEEAAALQARIDELETENIVATEGKYARTEYMSYWTYDELLIRAKAAEAEVAALRAQVAELEAADQWRPVSEPPVAAGEYLGWDGYRIQIVQYLPEYEGDAIDWPWWDRYDDEIEVTRWATLLDPPTEAPAP